MNPEQIKLIQESWAKVVPIAPTAAQLFYERLFETAPEVRPLFKTDLKDQGAKLMKMLGTIVARLDHLGELVPAAQALAVRHVAYGVKAEHYAPVGAALLWTLGRGLGDAFTPAVEAAWSQAYSVLAEVMIGAAYPVEA